MRVKGEVALCHWFRKYSYELWTWKRVLQICSLWDMAKIVVAKALVVRGCVCTIKDISRFTWMCGWVYSMFLWHGGASWVVRRPQYSLLLGLFCRMFAFASEGSHQIRQTPPSRMMKSSLAVGLKAPLNTLCYIGLGSFCIVHEAPSHVSCCPSTALRSRHLGFDAHICFVPTVLSGFVWNKDCV